MSDSNDVNPNDFLEGLSFAPSWAKGSAQPRYSGSMRDETHGRWHEDGERHSGDDSDRQRRHENRRDRPRRDREFGERKRFGDNFPRKDRPGQSDSDNTRREHRHFSPQQRPAVREPAPFSVKFLPDQKALTLVARKIQSGKKAMSLREIVGLFFKNPDSILVRVEFDDAHKDLRFHQCTKCGWFSTSPEELRRHLLSEHFKDYFLAKSVEVEPPKGKFSSVARCGVTGVLLAPPNYHSYNRRIREMLSDPRCAGIDETEYRRLIKLETDPETIEQWRSEQTSKIVYESVAEIAAAENEAKKKASERDDISETGNDGSDSPAQSEVAAATEPEPTPDQSAESESTQTEATVRQFSRDDAEGAFLQDIAPGLSKSARAVTASHEASNKIGEKNVLSEIRHAWTMEQRNHVPALLFAVRGGLKARKLALFRVSGESRNEFVSPIAPTPLVAESIAPDVKEVLDFVASHQGVNRDELVASLSAGDSAKTATVSKSLAFLVGLGHVVEFVNGVLSLGEPHPYYRQNGGGKHKAAPVAENAPVASQAQDDTTAAPATADGDATNEAV